MLETNSVLLPPYIYGNKFPAVCCFKVRCHALASQSNCTMNQFDAQHSDARMFACSDVESCVYLCLLNSTLTIHVCANLKSGRWKNKLTKAQTH